ncbi:RNA polymerase factor sigma-54 [Sediminibacillus dalangtanensis]|uniref:RNA polymerase factor sigma-54 n=1 Tax=Sediminibacillus dalangtanensis TaxID=2729421 RepID=A0ABX7VNM8_9BACI|nr:RNA polymerase factor sigma-54 [Sediminibacillus dalangtanensis]QTM98447.1 RNA polymerase factor sigma-54 [Sediminibacillus dalangtanensis]
MKLGLYQQQKQKVAMTPEMKQAITVLRYSTADLAEYIQKEALENPLIELEPPKMAIAGKHNKEQAKNPLDFLHDRSETLSDYLLDQLSLHSLSAEEEKVVHYIIFSLNESGYFREDPVETASRLDVSLSAFQHLLALVQGLEPAGVAATSLGECLALQLDRRFPNETNAKVIVTDHLEDVAQRNWPAIADALQLSEQDVIDLVEIIKSLNPKPGASFDQRINTPAIMPDLYVKMEQGQLFMQTNDWLLPTIRISDDYNDLLQAGDTEVKSYVMEKYKKALWLSKSIDQRRHTLQKIMQAIIEKQQAFFKTGSPLLPLTIKEIASRCVVHESTVSRATKDKYVHTPHGIFELKYFFSSGIQLQDGNAVSAHFIKQKIKAIIQEENPTKPLSDQKITALLNKEGILLSRRTVAKYREQLHIPSTTRRKSKKQYPISE